MKTFLIILGATFFFSCNSPVKTKTDDIPNAKENKPMLDCEIALKFINDYARFCTPATSPAPDSNWIKNNPLLTDHFKMTYKNLLDSAQKADPELGLDFDPVFDAQDFPEKGFESVDCNADSGYVTVRGKDWKDFMLVLRVTLQNDTWLVDGSGIINIPTDKRAKR